MRILITGADGQLGRALQQALAHDEVAPLGHRDLDVTDPAAAAAVVNNSHPDVVLHGAALTDTARCEREPALADMVNATGTQRVAEACRRVGARLVAISTNEVFDGGRGTPYEEDDRPAAPNAYGASKLRGEQLAAAAHTDTIIVRTAWLYGDGQHNFVARIGDAAAHGGSLQFVTDEVSSPTSAPDLADAIRVLIEHHAPAGIYHVTNEGAASRFEWAQEIVRLTGMPAMIKPTTTDELRACGYAGPRKPPYSVLANTRARALGVTMRPWQDALASWLGQLAQAHG